MNNTNNYLMAEYDLKILQSYVFQILVEFDRICTKNDIKYSLEGGTLLGAIKYKGFVPWDDDIDVVMLREEYDKFIKICDNELDKENFVINNFYNIENFPLNYSKLCYKHSLIYDYSYSKINNAHDWNKDMGENNKNSNKQNNKLSAFIF